MIVREHEFINGTCPHCGGRYKADDVDKLTCTPREVPDPVRPVPKSIFYDPSEIGARLREIKAEEDQALAGTAPFDPA